MRKFIYIFISLSLYNFLSISAQNSDDTSLVEQDSLSQWVMQEALNSFNNEDYITAYKLFSKASESNNKEAEFYLGTMYDNGYGVEQNHNIAHDWFLKAANKGHLESQNNLGYFYQYGIGCTKNIQESVKWYKMAADAGYGYAQFNLGYYYLKGDGNDPDLGIKYYKMAVESGNIRAINDMANFYLKGTYIEKDENKAFELLNKAASKNDALAMYNLGCCYQLGAGIPMDLKKAYLTFVEAAKLGSTEAMYVLSLWEETSIILPEGVNIKKPEVGKVCDKCISVYAVTKQPKATVLTLAIDSYAGDNQYAQWITLDKDSYIQYKGKKYNLIKTDGLAISPDKTYYDYLGQVKYAHLYFQPLPKKATEFDFIESLDGDWRIYNISYK